MCHAADILLMPVTSRTPWSVAAEWEQRLQVVFQNPVFQELRIWQPWLVGGTEVEGAEVEGAEVIGKLSRGQHEVTEGSGKQSFHGVNQGCGQSSEEQQPEEGRLNPA